MRSAISRINKHGVLLVFPINNKKEPHSLWSDFFPRTKLRWEWDESGDNKVFDMWALMKRLSDCKKVVYSKWYQNRATFFSRDLFRALLCIYQKSPGFQLGLSHYSLQMLDVLEQDSPLSTKELKQMTDLRGKLNEPFYNRGLRELFQRFMVVGFGEVEDGAFPSLAVGATRLLYEDIWNEAQNLTLPQAHNIVEKYMPQGSAFKKHFEKNLKSFRTAL